jgi:hypothetical protein
VSERVCERVCALAVGPDKKCEKRPSAGGNPCPARPGSATAGRSRGRPSTSRRLRGHIASRPAAALAFAFAPTSPTSASLVRPAHRRRPAGRLAGSYCLLEGPGRERLSSFASRSRSLITNLADNPLSAGFTHRHKRKHALARSAWPAAGRPPKASSEATNLISELDKCEQIKSMTSARRRSARSCSPIGQTGASSLACSGCCCCCRRRRSSHSSSTLQLSFARDHPDQIDKTMMMPARDELSSASGRPAAASHLFSQ